MLAYITLGGLSGAIYNEVLQFFVILAGLIPIVVVGLVKVGGWSGLCDTIESNAARRGRRCSASGAAPRSATRPTRSGDWIGIVFGLGFVLSFGYWTTNFAEVQRALAAKDLSAGQRTPLIGAYPKIFIPAVTIIPGLIALVLVPNRPAAPRSGDNPTYNDAIPRLMGQLLPNGVLGIALTGLLAAFMAGMAANVSAFNTVFTYDIWRPYFRRDRPDTYYLQVGRVATVAGVLIGIGTAFIAAGYKNIMNYIQLLFSIFNAPLFATFIIGMFWKRTTPWGGFWGLVAGTLGATDRALRVHRPGHRQLGRLGPVGDHRVDPVAELLRRDHRLRRRRGRHGRRLAGHRAEAGAGAGRPGGRRARPGRPAAGTEAGLVAVAEAARLRRAGHHPRPQPDLPVGGGTDMSNDIDDHNPEDTTASRLFDLRTLIGGLFVLYGVLLIVVGLFDSEEEIAKADGIRINLWLGLAMLVLGRAVPALGLAAPAARRAARRADRAAGPTADRPPAH